MIEILFTNVHWLLLLTFVALIVYDQFSRSVRFFKRYNLPYDYGLPIFGSHYRQVFNIESWCATLRKLYYKYGDEPIVGMHDVGGETSFLICDPELVKQITTRDFNNFVNRVAGVNASTDPLIGHQLTNMDTDDWRRIRALLTPMFTSQKFKQIMVPSLAESRRTLIDFLMQEMKTRGGDSLTLNMMELCTRTGIDGFCLAALGIKTDSLRNNDDGFYAIGNAYVEHLYGLGGFEYFNIMKLPRMMKYLFKRTLTQTNVDAFYRDTFTQIADTRITKNIQRNDYLRIVQTLRQRVVAADNKYVDNEEQKKGSFCRRYISIEDIHLFASFSFQLTIILKTKRFLKFSNSSRALSPKTM